MDVYSVLRVESNKIILHNKDDDLVELPLTDEYIEMFGIEPNKPLQEDESTASSHTEESVPNEKVNYWCDEATKYIIQLYKDNEISFKDPKIRNDQTWKLISDRLIEKGFIFTPTQSKNKFKHLKKTYMKCKDNMSKASGASPINFKYLYEMDEIFLGKPNVQPLAVASSSLGSQINADVVRGSFTVGIKRESDTPEEKKTKKLTVLEMLKKSEESRERRHVEFLRAQQNATDVYERTMNKLIDKM
ncbi:unnamed protein product [Psylliodes chrysocephalus]|uniref:Myb/SANT-like DNA-binding domain-containing protein n=1 Tax=Psylliodes chrysocephalus TaxID=3402493 RepID=A0A9P0D0D8_9CUCU|nr:unnamed protein product [Psylliodes chrysocephala]